MKNWLKSSILCGALFVLSGTSNQHMCVFSQPSLNAVNPIPIISETLFPVLDDDLNKDGKVECISLHNEQVEIRESPCTPDSQILWQSTPDWRITHAEIGDLNHNGIPEVALLVWRSFQPWPIDSFLPNPGRIEGHHDVAGNSCHIILIEHQLSGKFDESWAGSALYRPVNIFRIVDLDGDSFQELVALETRYDSHAEESDALSVWQWGGFNFQLVSRKFGDFRTLQIAQTDKMKLIILTNMRASYYP